MKMTFKLNIIVVGSLTIHWQFQILHRDGIVHRVIFGHTLTNSLFFCYLNAIKLFLSVV